jgi:hypothetical protein
MIQMKMKQISLVLIVGVVVLLWLGCKGSEAYRGLWHATMPNGAELDIEFTQDSMLFFEHGKRLGSIGYKQYQYSNKNGVVSYGIQTSNDLFYTLQFAKSDGLDYLMVFDVLDKLSYLLCREKHLDWKETLGVKIPSTIQDNLSGGDTLIVQ